MSGTVYDRINDFTAVRISLASPNDIRAWSFGEVKKPETINYRTYRAEKDGLFCERIFGPERDWECFCGKYKGVKHKGIICDRCGVKVTHSRVRRKRMGHINLAAPVLHIWFFKAMPSRLGTLLDMKTSDLEKIIYFQDYVVVDPGASKLEAKQLLTEEEYRRAIEEYGDTGFRALMGAEAVRELLGQLNLSQTSTDLLDALRKTNSKQKIKELSQRLKLVEAIRQSNNDAAWMVLEVIPVIPPDLRPLVLLDSGNFASSDLNDLYRRIINRNNRLKKLIDLNAPEVIVRNEKRMLQQAVDALFDNGRCRRPVLGSSSRPLKSLTDMIKGKQGRFRENLLGKRVDYSARSVVVVGPELKLHQCGLPKKIALELYQPFIIRKLRERGLADTIKSAKKMLERREQQIWDILEEVIYQHPVLLNRAPTLHRMGIQAFEPVLVEGNAIRIHPLVCRGFNADFDGDQMAVHLPLSIEAQAEAHVLMMSTNNIFSPANGSPIMSASQDMVMGIYYLTVEHAGEPGERDKGQERAFANPEEAMLALTLRQIGPHTPIRVRITRTHMVAGRDMQPEPVPTGGVIRTTAGRCIFNDILGPAMPFYNYALGKGISRVIADCHAQLGRAATIDLLDRIKDLGFKQSTLAGLSFGLTDLRIPDGKQKILDRAQKVVARVEKNFQNGVITPMERHNQLIDIWVHARELITQEMMETLKRDWRDYDGNEIKPAEAPRDYSKGTPYLNPIYLMTDSGARGSVDQIRQLAGMRALMAKPSGEIIEAPIKANFREGLTVLEYFSSTHGARKGLADTALKTADSGYLTRKLADVAQNVIINELDCHTIEGITKSTIYRGEEVDVKLSELIAGRVARDTIRDPRTDEIIVRENELVTPDIARKLEAKPEDGGLGLETVRVRSPLTCESRLGICARCYGADLSTGHLVEEGLAVGIIGAQSIGEPGTQLTMRTFHTGGVASRAVVENKIATIQPGTVHYVGLNAVEMRDAEADRTIFRVLKRNGEIVLHDDKGRELERYKVPYGAALLVPDGAHVPARSVVVEWDAHLTPMLAEKAGFVRFQDIIEGETVRLEKEGREGSKWIVIEHKGDKHPRIIIEDSNGEILDFHHLPAKAYIEVKEGDGVQPGTMLARQPREISGTQDITGGLPRVTEIFEARKPKEPAVMAEISGEVSLQADRRRGKMTIIVKSEGGLEREHHVPQDKQLLVHAGDKVEAGQPLIEGPLIPHDILRINGEEDLQRYLLKEVQSVYRQQNVTINDKHVEIILGQMIRKVKIEGEGDSRFLPNEVIDKFRFRDENLRLAKSVKVVEPGDTDFQVNQVVSKEEFTLKNEQVEAEGGMPAKGRKPKPASAKTLLLGITKASLQSESFISAASFQETTKVLTQASLAGQEDRLVGLKENVILGRLVPAGTGFKGYQDLVLRYAEQPIPEALAPRSLSDAATLPAGLNPFHEPLAHSQPESPLTTPGT
ncbi:MAG: DNA-directed RNA polymerase subunit beta' [Phycisphaerales bacterium]|nr:DNA-directed RNA polymerase subunit beta' [Phycisphaerales bacterium]